MASGGNVAIFPNARKEQEASVEAGPDEKRNAPRIPAAEIPAITGLRISPHGAEAALVNISTTGLLADCGVRLKPGSTVTIQFEGQFPQAPVPGRVVRCSVARVTNAGGLRYHVAVAFAAAIRLPIEAPPAPPVVPPSLMMTHTAPPPPAAAAASAPAVPAEPKRPLIRNRW
jgi:hypothetical protein